MLVYLRDEYMTRYCIADCISKSVYFAEKAVGCSLFL